MKELLYKIVQKSYHTPLCYTFKHCWFKQTWRCLPLTGLILYILLYLSRQQVHLHIDVFFLYKKNNNYLISHPCIFETTPYIQDITHKTWQWQLNINISYSLSLSLQSIIIKIYSNKSGPHSARGNSWITRKQTFILLLWKRQIKTPVFFLLCHLLISCVDCELCDRWIQFYPYKHTRICYTEVDACYHGNSCAEWR